MNTRFFIGNTLISKAWLKLAKNQAKAKQQPDAELLLFESFLLSSSTLSFKNNRRCSENVQKTRAYVQMRLYDEWR